VTCLATTSVSARTDKNDDQRCSSKGQVMTTTELCWWALPAWISPGAVMYVFFNVLVGAIAVTSRVCRSPSSMVLDRIRLFSMFPVHHAAECYDYHTCLEADEQQVMSESASLQKPVPEAQCWQPRSHGARLLGH
jgi:hypothetical protein